MDWEDLLTFNFPPSHPEGVMPGQAPRGLSHLLQRHWGFAVAPGWAFTLGAHQLTCFKGKLGKGNCGAGRQQKGIGAKLAV